MLKRVILTGAVLMAASGCGDTGASDQPGTDSMSVAGSDYATRVNELCADLIDQVLPITGDKPHPSPQEFLGFAKKIGPVIDDFDSSVDALEVAKADRSAEDAFDAYRSMVDDANAALAEVARTGDIETFDAAFAAFLDELRVSPEKARLRAEGIECPAR